MKPVINQLVLDATQSEFQPAIVTGALIVKSFSCKVAGSYTATVDDVDGSVSLTAGDKVTIVYTNCLTSTSAGNFSRNGTVSTAFTKYIGDPTIANSTYELGANVSYQNLAIGIPATTTSNAYSVLMNGNLTLASANNPAGTSTNTLTVPQLTFDVGVNRLAYTDYLLSESTNNVTRIYSKSGQGTFSDSDLGSYKLSTPIAFQGNVGGNPYIGKLKIEGATSTAYVTAIDTFSAKLELDNGKDGSIDFTQSIVWGDLQLI